MIPGNRQQAIVEIGANSHKAKVFALIDERKDSLHLILSAHCCGRDFLFSGCLNKRLIKPNWVS
ncbi:hypothetical protein AB685_07245 [Bacillus sp. LL01]|nr:hypothetical protein AB685_07245 [Bacillus sp. LL01]